MKSKAVIGAAISVVAIGSGLYFMLLHDTEMVKRVVNSVLNGKKREKETP